MVYFPLMPLFFWYWKKNIPLTSESLSCDLYFWTPKYIFRNQSNILIEFMYWYTKFKLRFSQVEEPIVFSWTNSKHQFLLQQSCWWTKTTSSYHWAKSQANNEEGDYFHGL